MATTRRLGRPPDSSSEETRERIRDAARRCFAAHGYDGTTNRSLASEAGLTTGAIYHYFGSKLDLYVDVHAAVQRRVYDRFTTVAGEAGDTFAAKIEAVLDEAAALNRVDPSLANFLVAVRTDLSRHEELRVPALTRPNRRVDFFTSLIDVAVESGEIAEADREIVSEVVVAILTGLVAASSHDPDVHARAIEGSSAC